MTTLTATAIISAHDRASAVFARVGANARALGGRFTTAMGGLQRFGQAAAMNLGMPAALVGAMAARGEYEVDKLARVMQAAGELSDQQRKMLTEKAFEVSRATGESAAEILKGQRELILGGLDADTTAATSRIIAKVARANEMAGAQVAEDAITNASALGLPMATVEEKVKSLTTTLDFMSVVPAFSPMNWQDLSTAMKYVGPVAGALNVKMKDLGAALSMLAFAGFKGEEAGTALRTILTRLIAPTRKARIELAAAGIDQSQMFSIDKNKVNDQGALFAGLKQQGLMTDKEAARAEKILSRLKNKIQFDGTNVADYSERMNALLAKVLGIEKGDTQSREILKAAIDNHVFRAVGDLDMEKVFMAIKDLPLKALKEMFGLQRISQAKALANAISKIVQLPTGERVSAFKKLADELGIAIPDAADRKATPVLEGFAASMDRMGASLANIRHQIFASGFGDEISGVFSRLSDSVNELAKQDPAKLKQIGYAISGLIVAPAAGFAVSGIAALGQGLATLASGLVSLGTAFASTPILNKLLLGGGIAGLFLGLDNIGNIFGQGEVAANGAIMARKVGPLMELINALKGFGGETFGAIGDLAGKLQGLANELKSVIGIDPSTSLLGKGLSSVAAMVERITSGIRDIRRMMGTEAANPKETLENGGIAALLGIGAAALANPTGETGKPGPFDWMFDKDSAHNVRLRRERYQSDLAGGPGAPPNLPSIRAQFPDAGMQRVEGKATVSVNGQVQGQVTVDARIQVEGGGRVVDQSTAGGAVSGKLDPGESSMDLQGAP